MGRHEREPDSSGEQKFVNVITRAQKKLDENINNRDTHTHSQLEKSHDSEINLDSLGKLDKHTFRIEQECDRSLDLLREKAARRILIISKRVFFTDKLRKTTVPTN